MSETALTDNPIVFFILLLIAVAIVYPIMKMVGKGSMTQQKEKEIARKRALIAERKAATRIQAEDNDQYQNPDDPV